MTIKKLITGAPGAGKTTYARELAGEKGKVIDLDDFRSIAPDEETAKSWRDQAEEAAKASDADYYVVRTLADPVERAEVAKRLGAESTVALLTSPEVAKKRVLERDGDDTKHQVIDEWWENFKANDGEETLALDGEPDDPSADEPADAGQGSEPGDPAPTSNEEEPADPKPSEPTIEELLDKARQEEREKVLTEQNTAYFTQRFKETALARKLSDEAAGKLLGTVNPTALMGESYEQTDANISEFFEVSGISAPKINRGSQHGGYRGTEPLAGKEFGASRAEQFYKNRK
ncbi:AAA family ATPase [Rothia sp. (in: high G+C Gram-positive bacteria)]|uniref:AAA family ATPase n=1 Tax=Rothia sp. (in: high G+C Gram-positive bacteria) TaxID=1885016 RepID=UPI000EE3E647|nr:hypothetical protein [Rothia sp. (in: high G+C Gram-positive bacteria)]